MLWFTSLCYYVRTVSLFVIAFYCMCCQRLSVAESLSNDHDVDDKPLMGHGTGCGMAADGFRHCGILPKIAVIGAGISGASSAFYLRQLFGNEVSIDIYEKHKVGGRLASAAFNGKEYESGGSVIHPGNAYMVNFTRMFGLHPRDRESGRLGIFDGKKMVFDSSRWGLVTLGQLLWHYGWDIYRMQAFVDKVIVHFRRIYTHQANGEAFTNLEGLLSSMSPDFLRLLRTTLADELRLNGFSELLIRELVNAGIRCNYGQNTNIHAFVGMVSMAGMQSGLWSIHGGNRLMPEKLVNSSEATIIHADVHTIVRRKTPKKSSSDRGLYQLQSFELGGGSNKYLSRTYDIVVIAAPLHDDIAGIQFEKFDRKVVKPPQHFHKTVSTFVSGFLNATMFSYRSVGNLPGQVLTSKDGLFFNSIGRQTAVNFKHANKATSDSPAPKDNEKQKPVWKIFSPKVLTTEQLDSLFLSYSDVHVVDWAAYPQYSSNANNMPVFELGLQLYYANAMEMASSTMETCVVSGRNVALLAYNRWFDKDDKIDNIDVSGQQKDDKKRQEL